MIGIKMVYALKKEQIFPPTSGVIYGMFDLKRTVFGRQYVDFYFLSIRGPESLGTNVGAQFKTLFRGNVNISFERPPYFPEIVIDTGHDGTHMYRHSNMSDKEKEIVITAIKAALEGK